MLLFFPEHITYLLTHGADECHLQVMPTEQPAEAGPSSAHATYHHRVSITDTALPSCQMQYVLWHQSSSGSHTLQAPSANIHIQQTFIKSKYSPQQLRANYGLREQKPRYMPNLHAFTTWATASFHAGRTVYQALRPTSMGQEQAHINMYLGFNHMFRGALHKPSLLVGLFTELKMYRVTCCHCTGHTCCCVKKIHLLLFHRSLTPTPSTTWPSSTSLCREAHSPTTSKPTSKQPGTAYISPLATDISCHAVHI